MPRLLLLAPFLFFAAFPLPAHAQAEAAAQKPQPPPGMAEFAMALLSRGPKWTAESTPEAGKIQTAHLNHIRETARAGKLVLAGPFLDDAQIRGVFVFRTSLDEAKALTKGDPAVKAGQLAMEIHPWWGPVDLGAQYAAMCEKAAPDQLPMAQYQLAFLTRGPSWTAEVTPEVTRIQEGHMANINRLAKEGKLIAAGPFVDGGTLRGVFVFKVGSIDEAKTLAKTDPAVKAGPAQPRASPVDGGRGVDPGAEGRVAPRPRVTTAARSLAAWHEDQCHAPSRPGWGQIRDADLRGRQSDLRAETVAQDRPRARAGLQGIVARGDRTSVLLALAPAGSTIDPRLLAAASGDKRIEVVALKEVLELTGYVRGAVTPVGLRARTRSTSTRRWSSGRSSRSAAASAGSRSSSPQPTSCP